MANFSLKEHSHRRYNILTGEWIQVSPHRTKRPWQGKQEEQSEEKRLQYDENCYLCPGNSRAGGKQNPNYTSTFVFTNDFSALEKDIPEGKYEKENLLFAKSEKGICRVVCFSPRHDLTLAEFREDQLLDVIEQWKKEYQWLGEEEYINYVQIFENKGSIMGCSNPHPHGQIWAQETVPVEPARESQNQGNYYQQHGRSMLSDYLELELSLRERIVLENRDFIALVPFWAIWPFETMIISKRHIQKINQFSEGEKRGFADVLKRLTVKYDNLFNTSFPYSAGMHQSPTDGMEHTEWHFHMHFYPPLLRSATIKKFMVGYEMLANPQRDFTPEYSAQILAELSEVHYKQ
ncbi:MAG: UDP-glucose--hexose-1-phosphate uridylyltransferase [Bacteroidales bacterium]